LDDFGLPFAISSRAHTPSADFLSIMMLLFCPCELLVVLGCLVGSCSRGGICSGLDSLEEGLFEVDGVSVPFEASEELRGVPALRFIRHKASAAVSSSVVEGLKTLVGEEGGV